MKFREWTTEKPDKPCICVVKYLFMGKHLMYELFKLYWVFDVGLCVAENRNGEWEDWQNDYADWNYAEYMILEVKDE